MTELGRAEERNSGKVFGFEKKKEKPHLIGFRLDEEHFKKLNRLFEVLEVHPKKDRMTDKMLLFIDRVQELVDQPPKIEKQLERIDIDKKDNVSAVVSTTKTLPPAIKIKKSNAPSQGKIVGETKAFEEKGFTEFGNHLPYHPSRNRKYNPDETMLKASRTHAKATEITYSHKCLRNLNLNDPDTAERACRCCYEKENHYYSLCKATVKFPVQHTPQQKLFPKP